MEIDKKSKGILKGILREFEWIPLSDNGHTAHPMTMVHPPRAMWQGATLPHPMRQWATILIHLKKP